jgi:ribosomal protein S18 acetylase RimI-like enzyme
MDITYRLAGESDLPGLLQSNMGLIGKIIDEEILPTYTKEHRVFCAVAEERIVSLLYWDEHFLGEPRFWFIHQVTTIVDWRRKGIASELIKAFLKYAVSFGVKKVFVDVRKNNERSIGLNRKLGAVECGWLKGLDDDSDEDIWKIFRFDLSEEGQTANQ